MNNIIQDKYLDGTDYFGINQNGTLFLKRNLDYETSICGVRSDARLYLDVVIKVIYSNKNMLIVVIKKYERLQMV